jgi:threonine 3-dehydrogenase
MTARLMRALVKAKPEPGLVMEEVPVPEPQVGEVLVKVRRSAICGTDLHIWNWDSWARRTIPVPMVVGHEYVGEVHRLGSGVRGFEIGEAVTSEGHIVCGHCRNCRAGREHLCPNTLGVGVNRPGSFAEFVCVPAHNVYPIPANIPERVAAILDPYGNAIHTALTFDLVGEDVLITGAGPIGIMAVPIALRAGARHVVITDVNDYRLDIARRLGATRAVNVAREELGTVMAGLEMKEGLRCRARNVGLGTSLPPDAVGDDPWRQNRHAGDPAGRHGDRLERGHFQEPDHQGDLWSGDVRYLVQRIGADPVGARYRACDHP